MYKLTSQSVKLQFAAALVLCLKYDFFLEWLIYVSVETSNELKLVSYKVTDIVSLVTENNYDLFIFCYYDTKGYSTGVDKLCYHEIFDCCWIMICM